MRLSEVVEKLKDMDPDYVVDRVQVRGDSVYVYGRHPDRVLEAENGPKEDRGAGLRAMAARDQQ